MKETSTPINPIATLPRHREPQPKRSTIAFLKSFARAYCAQPSLHPGIQGMILN